MTGWLRFLARAVLHPEKGMILQIGPDTWQIADQGNAKVAKGCPGPIPERRRIAGLPYTPAGIAATIWTTHRAATRPVWILAETSRKHAARRAGTDNDYLRLLAALRLAASGSPGQGTLNANPSFLTMNSISLLVRREASYSTVTVFMTRLNFTR
jgi:hypothetical protein